MKKTMECGLGWILGIAALTVTGAVHPMGAYAQQAQPTATVHGHANDPAGTAIVKGQVRFTTDTSTPEDKRVYKFTFDLDKDGNYTATGITPATYLVVLQVDGKTIDFHTDEKIVAGDNKQLDFDLTREEYLKSLTPEQRKALEETKKKNAGVMAENAKIKDLNKTLLQARADEKAGKAEQAVAELQPMTTVKPDEPIIWAALGEAQLSAGDQAAAALRAAKSPIDDATKQKYADAVASYQKAVDLNAAKAKPSVDIAFSSYLNMGQALGRSGKPDEAAKEYENAAKADPTKAGTALYNEAAVYFNAQKLTEANAAADKAIAVDPNRPELYYIKASSLIPNATQDPQTKKFVLPPGCLEAYQKYLELAPTGPHAADVKGLLDSLQQPQKSSFKASKK